MHIFSLSYVLTSFVILVCVPLLPSIVIAEGTTCDYYHIPQLPVGWAISMPPGINNEQHRSLGHFYNEKKNCAVMIQIAETRYSMSLDDVVTETLNSLKTSVCKILSTPQHDGKLMSMQVTRTGIPGTLWIGTNAGMMALTVATGDLTECRIFLDSLRDANPALLPVDK